MSSQAAEELGLNAVMVYFPWLPYYQRYQMGFDIIVNPSGAQADPSVADPPLRVVHVQLQFPDGFMCNPASFGRLPHPLPSSGGAPRFLPPHPHFHPPMFPTFPHAPSLFHHRMLMGLQQPMMRQEEREARAIVNVVNGAPGDWMVVDDTPYSAVRQCNECGDFHRDPDHVHNKQPQAAPTRDRSQQTHKQPRRSRQRSSTSATGRSKKQPSAAGTGRSTQQLSTSGTPGQSDMSHAAPYTASKDVATPPKKLVMSTDKANMTQQTAGEPQYEPNEGLQGMKPDNNKVFHGEVEVVTIDEDEDRQLDVGSQKNDENVAQGNKRPSVDRATQMGD